MNEEQKQQAASAALPQEALREAVLRLENTGADDEADQLRALLSQYRLCEREPVAWRRVENYVDENNLWEEKVTISQSGSIGQPLYAEAQEPPHDQ